METNSDMRNPAQKNNGEVERNDSGSDNSYVNENLINGRSIKPPLQESKTGLSGIKRRSSDTNEKDVNWEKFAVTEYDGNQSGKKRKVEICSPRNNKESSSHTAEGLEKSLHGVIFQLKLLMLFEHRGREIYDYFRLYTECPEAEKFDDVVFGYKAPEGGEKLIWQFVQAKHRLDPEKEKIKVGDLTSADDKNPFSLQKYFTSFCKIKQNGAFEGDLKDFIVITNTGIDFDTNNPKHMKWKSFFECKLLPTTNKILHFGKGEKIVQFNEKSSESIAEFKSLLLNRKKHLELRSRPADKNKLKDLEETLKNFDNYIQEFLDKFRFVVNYPGEKDLGYLIRNELTSKSESLTEKVDFLKSKFLYDSYETVTLDWFKSAVSGCLLWEEKTLYKVPKDCKLNPSSDIAPLKEWEVTYFSESLCQEINSLLCFGLSETRLAELGELGLKFKKEISELENFLSPTQNKKQIFHFITKEKTTLSAIRVFSMLGSSNTYKERTNYIFMPLKHILLTEVQKIVLGQALNSEQGPKLFVIECQTKSTENEVENLYDRLSKIISHEKKIVLIAQSDDGLARMFFANHKDKCQSVSDETNFKDLYKRSGKKILEKKINFQGRKVCLNELIDEKLAGEIFDQESLSIFLEEEISLGDKKDISSINHMKEYYIPRTLHRQRVGTNILTDKIDSMLFFVTGANRGKLNLKEEDIWTNGSECDNGIILPSERKNENCEIFQSLSENVYWLEYQNEALFWRAFKGDPSAIKNYIDQSYTPDENDILEGKQILGEKFFNKPETVKQKIVIIANNAGFGKSTLLTSLAEQMKDNDPALWLVRINLNDHAFEKKFVNEDKQHLKSFDEIDIKDINFDTAIDFVSDLAVPGNYDQDTRIKLQRVLFKAGLEFKKPKKAGGRHPKIIIMFDGFDEIRSEYKSKATKLLKILKTSTALQLWVTTRVHEKANLELELESPAYILNNLTNQGQKRFLDEFWRRKLQFLEENPQTAYKGIVDSLKGILENKSSKSIESLNNTIDNLLKQYPNVSHLKELREDINKKDKLDFSIFAEKLLTEWQASITDEKGNFTCSPLQLKMLAEVVFEKGFRLPKNLNLSDIYGTFVQVKFEIAFQEKMKTTPGNQGSDKMVQDQKKDALVVHHKLALKLLFPKEPFSNKQQNTFKGEELARFGLLALNDGKLVFIHRSFAEYFLSDYLIKNLEKEKIQTLLLNRILMEDRYDLIRRFFSEQLENPEVFHSLKTIIKASVAKSYGCNNASVDSNVGAIVNDDGANDNGEDDDEDNGDIDGAYEDIAEVLLERFKNNPGTFKELVLMTDQNKKNVLDLFSDNSSKIKALVNWVWEKLGEKNLNRLVHEDASNFFENNNYEVIDCLLRNRMKVEYLIEPKVRGLLNSDNDYQFSTSDADLEDFNDDSMSEFIEIYLKSSLSEKDFQQPSNETTIGLRKQKNSTNREDSNRLLKVRRELRSKFIPILDKLKIIKEKMNSCISEKTIQKLIDDIDERFEENKADLKKYFNVHKKRDDSDPSSEQNQESDMG